MALTKLSQRHDWLYTLLYIMESFLIESCEICRLEFRSKVELDLREVLLCH